MIDNKIRYLSLSHVFNEEWGNRDAGSHDSNRLHGPLEPGRRGSSQTLFVAMAIMTQGTEGAVRVCVWLIEAFMKLRGSAKM
jgi:hypothetical protein